MIIKEDISVRDFEFWSGGFETWLELTIEELDALDDLLPEAFPEGLTQTELNDLFWFDSDLIAEWLGFEDWENLIEEHEREDD